MGGCAWLQPVQFGGCNSRVGGVKSGLSTGQRVVVYPPVGVSDGGGVTEPKSPERRPRRASTITTYQEAVASQDGPVRRRAKERRAQSARSNTAIDSTWAVCGNMFTTPAWVQR